MKPLSESNEMSPYLFESHDTAWHKRYEKIAELANEKLESQKRSARLAYEAACVGAQEEYEETLRLAMQDYRRAEARKAGGGT